jgi:hypothetical protein
MQQRLPSQRSAPQPTADERELLAKFIDAHERRDAAAAAAIAAQDIRVTMPPQLMVFDGLDAIAPLLERAFGDDREGEWRLLPTTANRMPTAASYLLRPGDTLYRAFKFDVLRVEDREIAEITTFGPSLFGAFDLPRRSPRDRAKQSRAWHETVVDRPGLVWPWDLVPVLGLRMPAGNGRGNNSVTMSVAKAEEPSARIDHNRIRESGRFDGTGVAGTRWARHPARDVDHGPRNPGTVELDELLE